MLTNSRELQCWKTKRCTDQLFLGFWLIFVSLFFLCVRGGVRVDLTCLKLYERTKPLNSLYFGSHFLQGLFLWTLATFTLFTLYYVHCVLTFLGEV